MRDGGNWNESRMYVLNVLQSNTDRIEKLEKGYSTLSQRIAVIWAKISIGGAGGGVLAILAKMLYDHFKR